MPAMPGLPAVLQLEGRRCLVVGGGPVAVRRAQALLESGGIVRVVAPRIDEHFARMSVATERRGFEPTDLEGVFLVVVATDDAEVNEAVAQAARDGRVLLNRADRPEAGDVAIPAHHRTGPITLAVDTGGVSASAAAKLRDGFARSIDPVWPALLEAAHPVRKEIQRRLPDDASSRTRLLRALTDPRSMTILEHRGIDALHEHWRRMIERATSDNAAPRDADA